MRINSLVIVIGACAALVLPSAAAAKPGQHALGQPFPLANRLCKTVANGHTPKRLQASVDQVTQACTDLKAALTQAQSDLQTATSGLQQQASDARDQARQACQGGDRTACREAIATARSTLKGLKDQLKTALTQYHVAVEAARQVFWGTIRSLRGGAGIKPDHPAS